MYEKMVQKPYSINKRDSIRLHRKEKRKLSKHCVTHQIRSDDKLNVRERNSIQQFPNEMFAILMKHVKC